MAKPNGNSGPKSYSKFSRKDVEALGLEIKFDQLFPTVQAVQPSPTLLENLQPDSEIMLGSEASKSHFIIAPVIREIVRRNKQQFSVFPGYTFDVDPEKGLVGSCDFIFTKTTKTAKIESPVFFIVEAKNESLETGGPQCIAEMYAAKIFNERKSKQMKPLYGVVTFGREWQFYKLDGNTVTQDSDIYPIKDLPMLLGVLQHIIDMM
jgi:hypothetical protein